MSHTVPLWINGHDLEVNTKQTFDIINAAENKTIHQAHSANVQDAKAAVDAAAAAFPGWSKTPLADRRSILIKAAELLQEMAKSIGEMQAVETSCPAELGALMAMSGVAVVKELASQITNAFCGGLPYSEGDASTTVVVRQPIGPMLLITPWNGPTYLGPRGIATALAAGCPVVLKASELCPQTYYLICQAFADAGVPAGVLNQIVTKREDAAAVTEAIISDPRIRKVDFVGSDAVGRIIGQMCGKHLKPIVMELGGKCPAIICKDANLEAAAKACAFATFFHHGQVCMSTDRIIVVKEVADNFCALLEKEVETWASMPGSAASKELCDKTKALIDDALQHGARFRFGEYSYQGAHETGLRPAIITDVSRESKLFDTESFGPVATLTIVDDEDKAIEVANDCSYGLTGGIWSADTLRALALGKRLECGIVVVNSGTLFEDIPASAWGQAMKGSGWGVFHGVQGIQEFLIQKTVMLRNA